jgi:UDP-N-acetylmuramoylalanine--D-glutamate ligase
MSEVLNLSQVEASLGTVPDLAQLTSRLDPAWNGARALVVGLGESGLAMAAWLTKCGAQVTVLDSRAEPPQKAALLDAAGTAKFVHAPLADFACEGFDFLAWSPGLSTELGDSAVLYQAAVAKGLEVHGELDLFLSALASQRQSGYAPKLIAVTGTNGKTTVTALTAHLCQAAGVSVQAAGNIGPSMLDAWMKTGATLPRVWVLELSSFQVAVSKLKAGEKAFDAACVLNLTQDHLDWHQSMASYKAAKLKLLSSTKVQVVGDDASLMFKEHVPEPVKPSRLFGAKKLAASFVTAAPVSDASGPDFSGPAVSGPAVSGPDVSGSDLLTADIPVPAAALAVASPVISTVTRFLSGAPVSIGDFGLVQDGSLQWLAAGTPGEEMPTRRKGVQTELIIKRLMPADALKIRGHHNHLNVLAALALCRAIALPLSMLLHGLRDYAGEPHRCELISIIDDVEYINDSKGTNVGATAAGLLGLGKPCHLILGGEGKGQDFAPLIDPVRKFVKSLLMIGRDAQLIAQTLAPTGVETIFCESLEDALKQGAARAKTGEAILLSPACASFDMFKGYVHRGQVFRELVNQLAQDRGQMGEVASEVST